VSFGGGSLYIADENDNRIRAVSTTGEGHASATVTTVAGTGTAGDSGDGAVATAAKLQHPHGVYYLDANDVYVADTQNHRVRVLAVGGNIDAFAGDGTSGSSGNGGAATNAQLESPWGLAYHGSTLYISDADGNVVRSVTAGTIGTLVGNGFAGGWGHIWSQLPTDAWFNQPYGLAWDPNTDALYIADTGTSQVYRVANSSVAVVAGDGVSGTDGLSASSLRLNVPTGVAVDASGNAYIADAGDKKIFELAFGSTPVDFAGTGNTEFLDKSPRRAARLSDSGSMVRAPDGTFVVADPNNGRIRVVDRSNDQVTSIGTGIAPTWGGDGGSSSGAEFSQATAVARDALGNLYVAEADANRVRIVRANGTVATFAGTGVAGFSGDHGPATVAQVDSPAGVAVDAAGNVYISDSGNDRIRKVDVGGTITTIAGGGAGNCLAGDCGDGGDATAATLSSPKGLALDNDGSLLIADMADNRVRKVDFNSGFIATIAGTSVAGSSGDGGVATAAELHWPSALAWDATNSVVFIADLLNHEVRKVEAGGISRYAGGAPGNGGDGGDANNASFDNIGGLAWNAASGSLYISDFGAHRIREVRQDGKVYAFSGDTSGTSGYAGDGGAYDDASVRFDAPEGMAINTWGSSDGMLASLFVAEYGHVREIDLDAGLIRTRGDGTGAIAGYGGDGQSEPHAAFKQPSFVAVDSNSNIFVADTGDERVRELDGNSHLVSTVAGAGGQFQSLTGLAVDGDGNIYVSDASLN
jgi:sugar lactone lactonase YvrE